MYICLADIIYYYCLLHTSPMLQLANIVCKTALNCAVSFYSHASTKLTSLLYCPKAFLIFFFPLTYVPIIFMLQANILDYFYCRRTSESRLRFCSQSLIPRGYYCISCTLCVVAFLDSCVCTVVCIAVISCRTFLSLLLLSLLCTDSLLPLLSGCVNCMLVTPRGHAG